MFGISKKRGADTVVTLDLHTTSPGERRPAIIRNRPKATKKSAGMNLYHRADQFLMRYRIGGDVQSIMN